MTGHEYLDNLLQQRMVSDTTRSTMRTTRDEIEKNLRKVIGSTPRIYYAGSYGKNTMLDVYHDLDIVVYYPSSSTKTLKEIYWEVYNTLNGTYWVQQKDVAIRLPYKSGFVVDVVPGRALDDTFRYANLFRSETDSRLQTSIKVHIETVQQSNLRGTMRLMKLWNVRHNLGLRSFFVELLVARVLKNTTLTGHPSSEEGVRIPVATVTDVTRLIENGRRDEQPHAASGRRCRHTGSPATNRRAPGEFKTVRPRAPDAHYGVGVPAISMPAMNWVNGSPRRVRPAIKKTRSASPGLRSSSCGSSANSQSPGPRTISVPIGAASPVASMAGLPSALAR